uniref:Endoplasmic reticulum oxidoreductin 1 n=1 Tax=Aureoumbra lagunensis TaxID=44058 RepID=A0A7S3K563_9STRA
MAELGSADLSLLSLLNEARALPFFSLFSIDMLANCAYLDGAIEECEFDACEILPLEPTPDILFQREAQERRFELDAWARFDVPTQDYYDLTDYPEGYTAYNGSHIWDFIYKKLSFVGMLDDKGIVAEPDDDWRAIFDRALSGVHASISCHVTDSMYTDDDANVAAEFKRRLGNYPDRIANMHFAFLLCLAALREARPTLISFDYDVGHTGGSALDSPQEATQKASDLAQLLAQLPILNRSELELSAALLRESGATANECILAFNQDKQFLEESGIWQMRQRSRAMLRVMDCIACGVCRLHGKICWFGVATALKIIFSDRRTEPLARVEIAALVVALEKLTFSVRFAAEMMNALQDEEEQGQVKKGSNREEESFAS